MFKGRFDLAVKGDENYREILKRIANFRQVYVVVGFQDTAQYPDGTSVVFVAICNEYGTEDIPARPFFAPAIDENESQIHAWREDLIGQYLDGKLALRPMLEELGKRVVKLVQAKIRSNVPPPNAPSTVEKKGHSQTLIDTETMLKSVTYKVFIK